MVEHIRTLKHQDGAGLCLMGGGDLARHVFNAGLIDDVGVNVHPVLLGQGIPMFQNLERECRLTLVETRALAHGCVYALYTVAAEGETR